MYTILLIGAFLASLSLTGLFRRYAFTRSLIDVPNQRSSHAVATPTGGGVAIVFTTIASIIVLGVCGALAWRVVVSVAGAGTLAAALGFLDDRADIAPRWRLIGHFVAAGWLLGWLGGVPPLLVFGVLVPPSAIGHVLAVLFVVWLVNLTNFMDGIDGIAAAETITVCAGGCLLYPIADASPASSLTSLVLLAASLGFLVWNWPPAKIFMGDTGSGFIGLLLAALALQAGWVAPQLFWAWVVLLGVFVVDATVTLIIRVARGERFYVAHRSHAYQHAALRLGRHLPVTLLVCGVNICWLLPIAILTARGAIDGALAVAMAYLPLVVAVLLLGGGRQQESL